MLPEISVIIPAYNAEDSICYAIDSALNQNDVNVEIIIINDGSQDATGRIVKDIYASEKRVKLINTCNNSGPSDARNTGIKNANGRWIALLDADDWFAQNRLSILLQNAIANDLDFIADSYYLVGGEKRTPHSTRFANLSTTDTLSCVSINDFIRLGMGSVKPLIKKDFLDTHRIRFDSSIWQGEDILLFVTMLLNNAHFGLLNTPLYYRTERPNSLSKRDKIKFHLSLQTVYAKLRGISVLKESKDTKISKALQYRTYINNDALAAARWRDWLNNMGKNNFPNIITLLNTARYMLLKKTRYPN
ncbi:MAG: glycosyltransferase family 2 protein [Gammaproteobacteria bacterium]|nr:glycosyltransferase family 2 protein [Gammaproteobacteria bacterium]